MSRATDYAMTDRERRYLQAMGDYSEAQSIPETWAIAAQRFGTAIALHAPHLKPPVKVSYSQLYDQIQQFATGLQVLGVKPGDRVSLF
ncbi:MAG TPA: AMP-binding protein, partial [Microcoleaceae cyanobacterium]